MGKHVHTTCMYYGMALTLLHRQCDGAGSAIAEGSSMLQDVDAAGSKLATSS